MSKQYSIDSLHGRVITYGQIKKLPSRNAFLNRDLYKETNVKISTGKPILFMPNDLHEMHLQNKKYEKSQYNIVLFGALLDGRRATVVISGIKPYFEAIIPKDIEDPNGLATDLYNKLKHNKYTYPESYEIIKGRKFKGYQKERITFVRFYFNKLKFRKEAIKFIRSKGYETTADDTSSYYRMVCRDYLTTFSSWVYLNEYNNKTFSSLRGTVFDVDIKNFIKCEEDITQNPILAKDNIMTVCWDIETYSPDGQLPKPDNPSHKIFMIGLTFQWHHANDQLLRICLVDHPCDPRPNYLTIVCEDEKKLIKAFGKLVFKMKPEFTLGFNDSDYDWPWLIIRGKEYPGVLSFLAECFDSTIHWKNYDDKDIFAYNFKKEHVKLEADAYADGQTLVFPGYINIDVRTIFRQLYPTAEKSSLNFYLELNKLGGKKDMPYQEMFRIYNEMSILMERRNASMDICKNYKGLNDVIDYILDYIDKNDYSRLKDKMAEVADYCVIDSQRCHELMNIRSVLMDRREVANLSYTSVFDALYRANGMKVRNLVIARGQKRGLKFSNINNNGDVEQGKYPGAYVFPPKKGLVTSKMTIAERRDHSPMLKEYKEWLEVTNDELIDYYDIIREYGPCLDQKTINEISESRIKAEKHPLRKCFIDFLLQATGRPITGLDFSSLYPSLIMTYNLSPEYIITNKKEAIQADKEGHQLHKIKFQYNGRIVRGWSIRHENKLDPNSPDCKFGVYPMILKELFDARKQMKKELHKWESQQEKLETLPREEFMKPENQEEYENVCFNFRYIDSKQKALKVFMNTFYGESGNKRSPFFVLQLAGAITSAGQDNIKMVQKHVEEEGCNVYYGDSVAGDTPLILRDIETKQVMIKNIDDLVDEEDWKSYDQFKPGEPDRICKQQGECDLQIWTEGDWHDISRVIRHKTNKKMFRVNTHIGCIDVTQDHSLMRPDRIKIKPSELKIGTELMHSFPTEFPEILTTPESKIYKHVHCNKCNKDKPSYKFYTNRTTGRIVKHICCKCLCHSNRIKFPNENSKNSYFSQYEYINCMNPVTKEEAFVWGFFLAYGTSGKYNFHSCIKYIWSITKCDLTILNKLKRYLQITEPNFNFKIEKCKNKVNKTKYRLVPRGVNKILVEKYRALFYDKRKYKTVPTQILNASLEIRKWFFDGYYGDCYKKILEDEGRRSFCCKGKITAQGLYYIAKSIGYKYINIRTREETPDIYQFRINNFGFNKNPIAVKKIVELPEVTQDTFVYDIETSKGSFNGGVGALTLKNTDSIYSAMPEKHFIDLDKKYFVGELKKKEYWTQQINLTFKVIAEINKDVNDMLERDNGTKFLKLAFEESLYPVAFLAKKKYYGIPHISIPNFQPKKLFIRGLEVKKRGVSDVLKKVCMNIMWDSVSLTNIYTLMQLVEKKIDDIYSTDWDFNDFVMTDVFKPSKLNVKVHTFVQRMLNEGLKVKPYERFRYVIIKKNPYKYDHRGRKKTLQIGERMEYADRAKEKIMEIDLDYYMKGSINGQLARLVTYDNIFHVEPAGEELDDLKTAEDKIYANSCKYIDNYCAKYYTTYQSKGRIYQKIFRMANSIVVDNLKEQCGPDTVSLLNSNYDIENLEEWLDKKAEKEALKCIKGYGKEHVCKMLEDMDTNEKKKKIKELQDIYFSNNNALSKLRERSFKERATLLQRNLRDNLCNIIEALQYNTNAIVKVSDKIKNVLNIDNMYNESNTEVPDFDDLKIQNINEDELNVTAQEEINNLMDNEKLHQALIKLRYIYINMVSNYNFVHKTRSIVDYLKILRNKLISYAHKPRMFNSKKYIKDSVDDIIYEMKEYK